MKPTQDVTYKEFQRRNQFTVSWAIGIMIGLVISMVSLVVGYGIGRYADKKLAGSDAQPKILQLQADNKQLRSRVDAMSTLLQMTTARAGVAAVPTAAASNMHENLVKPGETFSDDLYQAYGNGTMEAVRAAISTGAVRGLLDPKNPDLIVVGQTLFFAPALRIGKRVYQFDLAKARRRYQANLAKQQLQRQAWAIVGNVNLVFPSRDTAAAPSTSIDSTTISSPLVAAISGTIGTVPVNSPPAMVATNPKPKE